MPSRSPWTRRSTGCWRTRCRRSSGAARSPSHPFARCATRPGPGARSGRPARSCSRTGARCARRGLRRAPAPLRLRPRRAAGADRRVNVAPLARFVVARVRIAPRRSNLRGASHAGDVRAPRRRRGQGRRRSPCSARLEVGAGSAGRRGSPPRLTAREPRGARPRTAGLQRRADIAEQLFISPEDGGAPRRQHPEQARRPQPGRGRRPRSRPARPRPNRGPIGGPPDVGRRERSRW